jgi:hypothetical protein
MKISKLVAVIILLTLTIQLQAQSFLEQGLIAHYPLLGDAYNRAGTNNGTVIGATLAENRLGYTNTAYYFRGTDRIDCSDIGFPATNNPRTVSLWLNIESFQAETSHPFGYGSFGTNSGEPFFPTIWRSPIPSICLGSPSAINDWPKYGPISANVWYHLTIVYDYPKATLYLNGVDSGQADRPGMNTVLTGKFTIGGINGVGVFHGRISDVRVYNRSLSKEEVLGIYEFEKDTTLWPTHPKIHLIKSVKPAFSDLTPFASYQLQVSDNLFITYLNYGPPFVATGVQMVYPVYFDVENWHSLQFRLKQIP